MAAQLGTGIIGNKQSLGIHSIRRRLQVQQSVAPEAKLAIAAELVSAEANDPWSIAFTAWVALTVVEFEVNENNFLEARRYHSRAPFLKLQNEVVTE